jgi:hypothetical protein
MLGLTSLFASQLFVAEMTVELPSQLPHFRPLTFSFHLSVDRKVRGRECTFWALYFPMNLLLSYIEGYLVRKRFEYKPVRGRQ